MKMLFVGDYKNIRLAKIKKTSNSLRKTVGATVLLNISMVHVTVIKLHRSKVFNQQHANSNPKVNKYQMSQGLVM